MLTASSESFPNNTSGWTNPYRYDGRDGVRYDSETGLYWMSVRAYDPTLGRFLQHDPLGRAPLYFADQPYVYAGNNPLINVDPSGERMLAGMDSTVQVESARHRRRQMRIYASTPHKWWHSCSNPTDKTSTCTRYHQAIAKRNDAIGWMLPAGGAPWVAGALVVVIGAINNVIKGVNLTKDLSAAVQAVGALINVIGILSLLGSPSDWWRSLFGGYGPSDMHSSLV